VLGAAGREVRGDGPRAARGRRGLGRREPRLDRHHVLVVLLVLLVEAVVVLLRDLAPPGRGAVGLLVERRRLREARGLELGLGRGVRRRLQLDRARARGDVLLRVVERLAELLAALRRELELGLELLLAAADVVLGVLDLVRVGLGPADLLALVVVAVVVVALREREVDLVDVVAVVVAAAAARVAAARRARRVVGAVVEAAPRRRPVGLVVLGAALGVAQRRPVVVAVLVVLGRLDVELGLGAARRPGRGADGGVEGRPVHAVVHGLGLLAERLRLGARLVEQRDALRLLGGLGLLLAQEHALAGAEARLAGLHGLGDGRRGRARRPLEAPPRRRRGVVVGLERGLRLGLGRRPVPGPPVRGLALRGPRPGRDSRGAAVAGPRVGRGRGVRLGRGALARGRARAVHGGRRVVAVVAVPGLEGVAAVAVAARRRVARVHVDGVEDVLLARARALALALALELALDLATALVAAADALALLGVEGDLVLAEPRDDLALPRALGLARGLARGRAAEGPLVGGPPVAAALDGNDPARVERAAAGPRVLAVRARVGRAVRLAVVGPPLAPVALRALLLVLPALEVSDALRVVVAPRRRGAAAAGDAAPRRVAVAVAVARAVGGLGRARAVVPLRRAGDAVVGPADGARAARGAAEVRVLARRRPAPARRLARGAVAVRRLAVALRALARLVAEPLPVAEPLLALLLELGERRLHGPAPVLLAPERRGLLARGALRLGRVQRRVAALRRLEGRGDDVAHLQRVELAPQRAHVRAARRARVRGPRVRAHARDGVRRVRHDAERRGLDGHGPVADLARVAVRDVREEVLRAGGGGVGDRAARVATHLDVLLHEGLAQDGLELGPRRRARRQHARDEVAERLAVAARDRRVAALDDLAREAVERVGVEGVVQRRHLVEHAAEGPDVGLVRVRLVLEDLLRARRAFCPRGRDGGRGRRAGDM